MSPSYRVSHEYVVEFPYPLAALAGEVVTLTDQISQWEGHTEWVWIWRRDARGKEGYTPLAYLDGEGSQRSLRVDYSARELSVREGQRVQALTTESGWAWCRADDGQEGWVPLSSLEMNG